jgi:hypothetical protein
VRSGRPPIDFLDIRILALLEEQPFIRFIRFLDPWVSPTQQSWVICGNRSGWRSSFTLDTPWVNDQFVIDSDANLPRVIAHSPSSQEKWVLNICDWEPELVRFGISSFYKMEHIARRCPLKCEATNHDTKNHVDRDLGELMDSTSSIWWVSSRVTTHSTPLVIFWNHCCSQYFQTVANRILVG